jgi:phosphate/sulfate permease
MEMKKQKKKKENIKSLDLIDFSGILLFSTFAGYGLYSYFLLNTYIDSQMDIGIVWILSCAFSVSIAMILNNLIHTHYKYQRTLK